MNCVAKTLLTFMRIEVLLGIGLVLWILSLEARAEESTLEPETTPITWEDANFQKHYELNSSYGQCIQSELEILQDLSFNESQPKKAGKKLAQLKKQVAGHAEYFERNAVKKKKPNKLFRRARDNSSIARDITNLVNWQLENPSGKAALIQMQLCYLSYHRDLKQQTDLGREVVVSPWIRERQEENVYNLARVTGASRDVATAASILGTPYSKGNKEPWSDAPKFFKRYTVMDKIGSTFKLEDLRLLDAVLGHMYGLKGSCACFKYVESRSVHTGYCNTVNEHDFVSLLERYDKLFQLLLEAQSNQSPSLIEGGKKARLKISDYPLLAAHTELVNSERSKSREIVKEARTDLEQTLFIYFGRKETQGLSCAIDAMSRGRTL